MSLVFVIVPAYNAEAYLEECLDSLSRQSLTDWQALVIDDGSTDGSRAVAERIAARDSRIQVETFPNGGVAAARNRGLARIPPSTQYVLLLDNDDFLTPDALETLVAHLDLHPSSVAAYGLACFVDRQGQPQTKDLIDAYGVERQTVSSGKRTVLTPDAPTTFASLVTVSSILTPGQVLIRASALRDVGEFDPTTVPSDDLDLWLRLSQEGDFVFLRQFVIHKRRHEENVSNNVKRMARAEMTVRRKLACSPSISWEHWRTARAGHLAACGVQIGWIQESWAQRDLSETIKRIFRCVRSYVWFLQIWAGRLPTKAPVAQRMLQPTRER